MCNKLCLSPDEWSCENLCSHPYSKLWDMLNNVSKLTGIEIEVGTEMPNVLIVREVAVLKSYFH